MVIELGHVALIFSLANFWFFVDTFDIFWTIVMVWIYLNNGSLVCYVFYGWMKTKICAVKIMPVMIVRNGPFNVNK